MIIGFSTGFLYKRENWNHVSKEAVDIIKSIGCNAIEFMARSEEQLKNLRDKINPDDLTDFQFISLHAPKVVFQGNKKETISVLGIIQDIHQKFNLNNVVIHPDEVDDWSMFSGFSFPLAVENMDNNKNSHRNIEDLERVFRTISAKMVLDLNHCYVNDPSMKLAYNFIRSFKDRICEIHISGFVDLHEPLFQTKQNEILNAVTDANLPIIIESGCNNVEDAKREFEYIKLYLSGKND